MIDGSGRRIRRKGWFNKPKERKKKKIRQKILWGQEKEKGEDWKSIESGMGKQMCNMGGRAVGRGGGGMETAKLTEKLKRKRKGCAGEAMNLP